MPPRLARLLALIAAVVLVVGAFTLSPLVGTVTAIVALAGAAAYGGRVLLAGPRDKRRRDRPDPFAVHEPWRRFVSDALDSRRRFHDAVTGMAKGPLHDRLAEIGDRLEDGVDEIWRIAQQGHTLTGARQRVDVDRVRRELAAIEDQPDETRAPDSRAHQTAEALRAQAASAERMDTVIAEAADRLRLLDARLDETVTRAVELSTGTGPSVGAGTVGGDIDGLVTEMEALRLALDEAEEAGAVGESADPGAVGESADPGAAGAVGGSAGPGAVGGSAGPG
ncbi:MAG TPA: hypothetical protein VNL12_20205, partial [Iamia sp.]